MTPEIVKNQIDAITTFLISQGFCDDQVFPSIRNVGGTTIVGIDMKDRGSIMLRRIPYPELFQILSAERLFSAKLADGALIQFLFEFEQNTILKNRMAYLPSPSGDYFRESSDLFSEDEIYTEVLRASYIATPFRFDFDRTVSSCSQLEHPHSHFTLGAVQSCRIPVTSPLTPVQFMKFVLQNFYHSKFMAVEHIKFPTGDSAFDRCISQEEQGTIHFFAG